VPRPDPSVLKWFCEGHRCCCQHSCWTRRWGCRARRVQGVTRPTVGATKYGPCVHMTQGIMLKMYVFGLRFYCAARVRCHCTDLRPEQQTVQNPHGACSDVLLGHHAPDLGSPAYVKCLTPAGWCLCTRSCLCNVSKQQQRQLH
jgi:hypothetical protein